MLATPHSLLQSLRNMSEKKLFNLKSWEKKICAHLDFGCLFLQKVQALPKLKSSKRHQHSQKVKGHAFNFA